MLTWPHKNTDWVSNLATVEPVFKQIVREISLREQVVIICQNNTHREHIQRLLDSAEIIEKCIFCYADSNDVWARDHGPITVSDSSSLKMLDFQFNGWGDKYAFDLDNAINQQMAADGLFSAEYEAVPFILEGGSIETDGKGTLLTTEHCLLSPKRNPQFSIETLTSQLKTYLGTDNILWLKHGQLSGDDTDGHIDTLARFCNETTIAYCSCKPTDEHYNELKAMEDELKTMKNSHGNTYQLIDLPLPDPVYDDDGKRLPATYANFLIINQAVLVPVYNDPQDQPVLDKLSSVFTDRQVIGINCLPIIEQYGSLHCLTMQLPLGVLA